MMQVASILFATAFTFAVCLLTGKSLLKFLRIRLYQWEECFFGFVLGSACLSTIVFALALAGLAYRGVFLAAGIALIAGSMSYGAHRFSAEKFPPLPRLWRSSFAILYLTFGVLYLINAMSPEVSADAIHYHVGLVARYYREHRLPAITTSVFASLSEGIEMLFLFAFAFGKHSAAAMVHLLYTLILPIGMLSCARRMGHPVAGLVGALLFFLSPVVGKTGSSAYVDVAVACIAFAVFYLLQIWKQQPNHALLVPIGLLAGFCYAAKYTAGFAIPYALGFVVLHLLRSRTPVWRPAIIIGICAAAVAAPWMVKNAVVVGNPFSPFANRYFPNPYVHLSFENGYAEINRNLKGVQRAEVPIEVTVRGGRLEGLVGPLFLLTPLILLAIRFPMGRQLALAAVVFVFPCYFAIATRYLIPALPFVSLGLGLVFSQWNMLAATVVLLHAFASWPGVVSAYSDLYAWRLRNLDWKAALRIRSEDDFLRREMGDYPIGLLIEARVPPGERVFTFNTFQQAYHSHELIVDWQSAFGNRIGRALSTPLLANARPVSWQEFHFPATAVRKLRLVQTQTNVTDQWSVSEVRAFRGGEELVRASSWRLRASPNPWDITLAFDNNPATWWTSAEPRRPEMFLEIDFGGNQTVDQVRAEGAQEPNANRMRVDCESSPGKWQPLAINATLRDVPVPPWLRRAATDYLKRNAIRWLAVRDSDRGATDFKNRQAQWGITLVGSAGPYNLYHLD